MKKAGIIGVTGKVGSIVLDIISKDDFFEFSGGISSKSGDNEIRDIAKSSDVLIDFSNPSAVMRFIDAAQAYGVPLVCGTTGFSDAAFKKLEDYSKAAPVLYASNFSISVHLMASILKKCSDSLVGYDVAITDKHHRNKKDAPSGTSLFLAKHLSKEPQMLSARLGNMPAEIICDFCNEDEILTISHRAFGRHVFAKGAVDCAKWIIGQSPKMYSMRDYIDREGK